MAKHKKQEQQVQEQEPVKKGRIVRTGGFFYRNFFNVGAWSGYSYIKSGGSFILDRINNLRNIFLQGRVSSRKKPIVHHYRHDELAKMYRGFMFNLCFLGLCSVGSIIILIYFLIHAHWFAFLLWILIAIILMAFTFKLFLAAKEANRRLKRG
jgi:hypothetical protein